MEACVPHKDNDAREFTVTEVSEKGVTMSDEGQLVSYDKDGNRIEGPSGGPGAKWLSFPIQVGKAWSFEFQAGSNIYTIEAKVAKITTVKTKAGTFEAAQIESCWNRKGGKFYECGFKIWYAPAVKRIVKREAPNAWASGRWANDNFELLSYKLVNNSNR